VAGTAGATTTLPDLQATSLSTDGTFVDFQFDKPLGPLPTHPFGALTHFEAWASDSIHDNPGCAETTTDSETGPAWPAYVPCTPNPQLPNNVVRAFFSPTTFPGGFDLRTIAEYEVKAAVTPGAVQRPNTVGNPYGEAPIGDNQGAFGGGFTTGPDAFRVTFDAATNTAAVLFDQRVYATTPSSFVLLDANGTALPGGTGVQAGAVATPATTPGTFVITVSFTGAAVTNAKALEIKGPLATPHGFAAVFTGIGSTEDSNVQDIVSPTGSAAVLKPGAKVHWVRVALKKHPTHHALRHHRSHKR
jgi:hypothetical protein